MHASLNVGYQGKSGPGNIHAVILVVNNWTLFEWNWNLRITEAAFEVSRPSLFCILISWPMRDLGPTYRRSVESSANLLATNGFASGLCNRAIMTKIKHTREGTDRKSVV